jgi:hypothetical protein
MNYRDGDDDVVTSAPPSNVVLGPGGLAYVTVNKYSCAIHDEAVAETVQLTPPGDSSALSTNTTPGEPDISFCGSGDRGSTLDISPVAATIAATRAY